MQNPMQAGANTALAAAQTRQTNQLIDIGSPISEVADTGKDVIETLKDALNADKNTMETALKEAQNWVTSAMEWTRDKSQEHANAILNLVDQVKVLEKKHNSID